MSNRVEIGKVSVAVYVEKGQKRSVGKWRKMSKFVLFKVDIDNGVEL